MAEPVALPGQTPDIEKMKHSTARNIQTGQSMAIASLDAVVASNDPDVDRVTDFLSNLLVELDSAIEPSTPNPHLRMILALMRPVIPEGRNRVAKSSDCRLLRAVP